MKISSQISTKIDYDRVNRNPTTRHSKFERNRHQIWKKINQNRNKYRQNPTKAKVNEAKRNKKSTEKVKKSTQIKQNKTTISKKKRIIKRKQTKGGQRSNKTWHYISKNQYKIVVNLPKSFIYRQRSNQNQYNKKQTAILK